MNADREVMDITQASEYLGISADTLYKYAADGFVPAFKFGNRPADLDIKQFPEVAQ